MDIGRMGSYWLKFDFHTHTPASEDYGKENFQEKSISPKDWVRSAMEANLDCVAVTDHDNSNWVDALKDANELLRNSTERPQWYRDLAIFPGVEITTDANANRIHILAIFDPSKTSEEITLILGKCGVSRSNDSHEGTLKSFHDVAEIIRREKGIPIAAHADQEKGLLYEKRNLTSPIKQDLKNLLALEFLDLNKSDAMDQELRAVLDEIAKVQGSDSHSRMEIGQRFSWVKMRSRTIEALQLALEDHNYAILNQREDPNITPSLYLTNLTIRNMLLCGRGEGRELQFAFHPHFNAIIGGRGSGKSTILESVRIVGRQEESLKNEAPETYEAFATFLGLDAQKESGVIRDDTHITLELKRDSSSYRIHWHYDGREPTLEIKTNNGWEREEIHGTISERFPLMIYSQKQINELARKPHGLLGIIDRSDIEITPRWNSQYQTTKNEFLALQAKIRSLNTHLIEEPNIKARLKDTVGFLERYEQGKHRQIFMLYQLRRQQHAFLYNDKAFEDFAQATGDLAESIGLSDLPEFLFKKNDPTTPEIIGIHSQTVLELESVTKNLKDIQKTILEIQLKRKQAIEQSKWLGSYEHSIAQYTQLEKEYEEDGSNMQFNRSLFDQRVKEKDQLETDLQKIEENRQEVRRIKEEAEDSLHSLLALRLHRSILRQKFIEEVIGDNQYVRMELIKFGDVSNVEEKYRSILGLESNLFINSVYDAEGKKGILWELIHWEENNPDITETEFIQIIEKIKSDTYRIAMGEDLGYYKSFANRLIELHAKNPVAFDDLDSWWPEDLLRVKFPHNGKNNKFETLEKGSDGQRAAAILAFLLSYGKEPLLIDQPEDDLDNSLIYNLIVRQIQESKAQRQLIVVTHNPNIVVNGDAELIHVMEFKGGQIILANQGGLEMSTIRRDVCTIMEGGQEALKKRYKRMALES